MAKKTYGHAVEFGRDGERVKGTKIKTVQMQKPLKPGQKGYDFVEPQAGRIAKAAGGKIADGIARAVFGRKR